MSQRQQTIIGRMFLEVCGACQNNCAECQHSAMRRHYSTYQLGLIELMDFIRITRESNYAVFRLCINGVGEPLLWKHFNEGVRLLRVSGLFQEIEVYTNGQAIETIEPETWECLTRVQIDAYTSVNPEKQTTPAMLKVWEQWHYKIRAYWISGFRKCVTERHPETMPATCESPGPMYCDGRIWPWCGPVVFNSCGIAGSDPFALSVPCEVGYMDGFEARKPGEISECDCCNANKALLLAAGGVEHAQKGGKE